MVDAVTSQVIFDGTRTAVMKFTNISDGTGETGAVKVDLIPEIYALLHAIAP